MNKKLILLLVLAIVAAVVFFWSHSPAELPMEAVPADTARKAADFAKKALETYRTAPDLRDREACFAKLDEDLTAQLKEHLDQLESPDFSKARVMAAKGDSNTYCVDAPDGGKIVRFIVEQCRGKLQLAACGGRK